jgi:hypothetical protein
VAADYCPNIRWVLKQFGVPESMFCHQALSQWIEQLVLDRALQLFEESKTEMVMSLIMTASKMREMAVASSMRKRRYVRSRHPYIRTLLISLPRTRVTVAVTTARKRKYVLIRYH